MEIKKLTEDFAVCGQITADQVRDIAAAGFRTLICNRPDDEQVGQPPHAPVAEAAAAHGLHWIYLPVTSGQITERDAENLAAALKDAPTPVLAYCRSGARSTMLWRLADAL